MKSKFFILGILIALFAVNVPLIADPGGNGVAYGLESSFTASIPTVFTADIVPTVAVVASLALVPILFVPAVRRRVFSIPWRTSSANFFETTRLKVRRQFDKLTKSPVLKHQSAA